MLTLLFKEMMNKEKTYQLTPSWKYFFWGYLLSILTIPLVIGCIAFYFVRKRHKNIRYSITDKTISAANSKYQQNIDLINIEGIEISRNWLYQKLDVGTLIIHTETTKMLLAGIERPAEIKSLIHQAVQALKKQAQKTTRRERPDPEHGPGSMEKMNYLTGLWQQGLISDEDYEEEREYFE